MKVKVSEASGPVLDWMAAKCEGHETLMHKGVLNTLFTDNGWKPSTDWAQGGPIIEREEISLWSNGTAPWDASMDKGRFVESGSTPLIAAMRCYVASKLGEEVEVPNELVGE